MKKITVSGDKGIESCECQGQNSLISYLSGALSDSIDNHAGEITACIL